MPGPVSDSYDPEFGTGDNAYAVASGIRETMTLIGVQARLGKPKNIVAVARGRLQKETTITMTERQWRLVRFGLSRALDTI